MFVRFVAATKDEDPWHADGVICTARSIRDAGEFAAAETAAVNAAFEWFNEHLPCPPFRDRLSRELWTENAISWYLATAQEPLERTWELAQLLAEHGIPVHVLRTLKPGRIVYRDGFQIVAEAPSRPAPGLRTATV